ncbi:MAG: hypothetical protein ISN26_06075 [Betaproteobacteria bacterium AqS2]|uniref:Uncharacterized protein n=1 Tax=Candidatus Amphirhobacter heronislandensis TaxID=1732024 RepID=A0A930XYE2_9GAMM|nr:hypothetical protein [Betaproteobacteria bacterium AqS2]
MQGRDNKDSCEDVIGEYILSAATLGISSVIGIWMDMRRQQELERSQADRPAAPPSAQRPQGEKDG